MLNGAARKCPQCGKGALFDGYIKVNHVCTTCGLELHHQRADDAPPYFTMLIVLHVVISGLLLTEQAFSPAHWVQLAIWIPVSLVLAIGLLPHVKGTLIGLQWARKMHGFSDEGPAYLPRQID